MANKRGRPRNPPKAKAMLKEIIPVADIFDEDELPIYHALVDLYLKDFEDEDLTSSDMDDVMSLATNKVLEIRLLKSSKGDAAKHLDISAAIEKLRKQNDKIKDNLSSRRKDRIDPARVKGLSIVDLAVAFEDEKKQALQDRVAFLSGEEQEVLEDRKEYIGNRYDVDADTKDKKGGYDD